MVLTIVDSKIAKVGYEFINYGDAEECQGCKLINACINNLEKGRKYRIVKKRDIEHDCKITGRAFVVEVEECDINGVLDGGKVFIGSKIKFSHTNCDNIFCKNMKYCKPEGLKNGDECKILDSLGKTECEIGKDLTLLKLKRL